MSLYNDVPFVLPSYAISTYHHKRCEVESRSGEMYSIHHFVTQVVCNLRQIVDFLRTLRFPPPVIYLCIDCLLFSSDLTIALRTYFDNVVCFVVNFDRLIIRKSLYYCCYIMFQPSPVEKDK